MKQIDIMKYKNFLWTALAVATISSAVQGQTRMSDTLQQSIRSSSKLTQVTEMAEKLVQSGFTAGDGYGEVWIRDLNSFVELSTKVNGQERTREALLMFFKFQQPDGNIPDGYIPAARAGAGYVYQTSPYEPDYRSHKNTVETDQETSLIQAVHKYIQATGDRAFLHIKVGDRTVVDRMHDALQYLLDDRFNAKYGLLWGQRRWIGEMYNRSTNGALHWIAPRTRLSISMIMRCSSLPLTIIWTWSMIVHDRYIGRKWAMILRRIRVNICGIKNERNTIHISIWIKGHHFQIHSMKKRYTTMAEHLRPSRLVF